MIAVHIFVPRHMSAPHTRHSAQLWTSLDSTFLWHRLHSLPIRCRYRSCTKHSQYDCTTGAPADRTFDQNSTSNPSIRLAQTPQCLSTQATSGLHPMTCWGRVNWSPAAEGNKSWTDHCQRGRVYLEVLICAKSASNRCFALA